MKTRFAHFLERRVGYEALLLAERKLVHRRAAEAVEARTDGGEARELPDDGLRAAIVFEQAPASSLAPVAQDLAEHWEESGEAVRAGLYRILSGRALTARGQADEARAQLGRARDLLDARDRLATAEARIAEAALDERQGRYQRGLVTLEAAEALVGGDRGDEPDALRARAWAGTGGFLRHLGRSEEAAVVLDTALRLARKVGLAQAESGCLNSLGIVRHEQGAYDEAVLLYEGSMAIRRRLGDRRGEAASMNNLSSVAWSRGEYAVAAARVTQALGIAREAGDRYEEAQFLNNLAITSFEMGDVAASRAFLEQGISLQRATGDRSGEMDGLGVLTAVCLALGEASRSREAGEQALAIAREIGSVLGEARGSGNLAWVLNVAGERGRTGALSNHAVSLAERANPPDRLCDVLLIRTRCRLDGGDAEGARADALRAAEISGRTGYARGRHWAAILVARIDLDEPAASAAAEELRRTGPVSFEFDAWFALAEIRKAKGDAAGLAQAVGDACALADRLGAAGYRRRAERLLTLD